MTRYSKKHKKYLESAARACAVEAYRLGLGSKDAQKKVKEVSSRVYTSHRRVPETLARRFDA